MVFGGRATQRESNFCQSIWIITLIYINIFEVYLKGNWSVSIKMFTFHLMKNVQRSLRNSSLEKLYTAAGGCSFSWKQWWNSSIETAFSWSVTALSMLFMAAKRCLLRWLLIFEKREKRQRLKRMTLATVRIRLLVKNSFRENSVRRCSTQQCCCPFYITRYWNTLL